jgi:hypothetical protein
MFSTIGSGFNLSLLALAGERLMIFPGTQSKPNSLRERHFFDSPTIGPPGEMKRYTMMKRGIRSYALCRCVAALISIAAFMAVTETAGAEREVRVVSESEVSGFVHPESAAYDQKEGVFYVSEFGSVLNPRLKDGMGRISKMSISGQIMDREFLPLSPGSLNKPKGIWIEGSRLWVTDIDAIWLFDITTRKGKALPLPASQFVNDPVVIRNVLYISDSDRKKIYRVEPADYLDENKEPAVREYGMELSFSPNGLYPASDGSLLVAGFSGGKQDLGVYVIGENESFGTDCQECGAARWSGAA